MCMHLRNVFRAFEYPQWGIQGKCGNARDNTLHKKLSGSLRIYYNDSEPDFPRTYDSVSGDLQASSRNRKPVVYRDTLCSDNAVGPCRSSDFQGMCNAAISAVSMRVFRIIGIAE